MIRLVLALSVITGCGDDGDSLRIFDDAGNTVLDVAIDRAETEEERRIGLRGRTLSDKEGLLIVLPAVSDVCIVNDGVTTDLDVLYFDAGLTVTYLERDVAAGDGTPRCHPAGFVLEVLSGVAEDVDVGDQADSD